MTGSLASVHPELIPEWSEKNLPLTPDAKTLDELRYKEEQIEKDKKDGIKAEARYTTLNDIYELWKDLKRGLKNNTFENYKYMYETFVRQQLGSKTVSSLKKSDIKRFYNYLADERHLKPATIDNTAELSACFDESFANLELMGAECAVDIPEKNSIYIRDAIRVYDFFEAVTEAVMDDIRFVWLKARSLAHENLR